MNMIEFDVEYEEKCNLWNDIKFLDDKKCVNYDDMNEKIIDLYQCFDKCRTFTTPLLCLR